MKHNNNNNNNNNNTNLNLKNYIDNKNKYMNLLKDLKRVSKLVDMGKGNNMEVAEFVSFDYIVSLSIKSSNLEGYSKSKSTSVLSSNLSPEEKHLEMFLNKLIDSVPASAPVPAPVSGPGLGPGSGSGPAPNESVDTNVEDSVGSIHKDEYTQNKLLHAPLDLNSQSSEADLVIDNGEDEDEIENSQFSSPRLSKNSSVNNTKESVGLELICSLVFNIKYSVENIIETLIGSHVVTDVEEIHILYVQKYCDERSIKHTNKGSVTGRFYRVVVHYVGLSGFIGGIREYLNYKSSEEVQDSNLIGINPIIIIHGMS